MTLSSWCLRFSNDVGLFLLHKKCPYNKSIRKISAHDCFTTVLYESNLLSALFNNLFFRKFVALVIILAELLNLSSYLQILRISYAVIKNNQAENSIIIIRSLLGY